MFLATFANSSANVALPALAALLGVDEARSVVVVFLAALSVGLLPSGFLAARVGARRTLVLGAMCLALGALLTSMAAAQSGLVVGRALQGFGAAASMNMAVLGARSQAARSGLGFAMGVVGFSGALGTALGPAVGGLVIERVGWRVLFGAQAVPALGLGLVVGRVFLEGVPVGMKPSRSAVAPPLVFRGSGYGVRVPRWRLSFCAVLWSIEPEFSMRLLANCVVGSVLMATLVVGPFVLTICYALSEATTGIVLAVGPFASAAVALPAGRLVDRMGPRRTCGFALPAAVVACAALAWVPSSLGVWGYLVSMVGLTISYSVFRIANQTSVLQQSRNPARRASQLILSRTTGFFLGAWLWGALFGWIGLPLGVEEVESARVMWGFRITFSVSAMALAGCLAMLAWFGGTPTTGRGRTAKRVLAPEAAAGEC